MRARVGLGLGVIAALAIAIWAAVSQGGDEPPATTSSITTTTTTTTSAPTTTATPTTTPTSAPTTQPPSGTTTEAGTDPEARAEEVRQLLQELWFRWLHAVYSDDPSDLNQVVATQTFLDSFESAVDTVAFNREPKPDDLEVTVHEILRDTPDCLVVHRRIDAGDLLAGESISEGVDGLWPHSDGWRLASGWIDPRDLWEEDCESIREELP